MHLEHDRPEQLLHNLAEPSQETFLDTKVALVAQSNSMLVWQVQVCVVAR